MSAASDPTGGANPPSLPSLIIPWLASALWMRIIYLLSDQPNSSRVTQLYLGVWNVLGRKGAHVCEYAILFCLYLAAFNASFQAMGRNRSQTNSSAPKTIAPAGVSVAIVLSILYAATDEWHQSFVPGRSASVFDVLVDTSGILLGLIVCFSVHRLLRPNDG